SSTFNFLFRPAGNVTSNQQLGVGLLTIITSNTLLKKILTAFCCGSRSVHYDVTLLSRGMS
ncbi:hypothetical protein L9F63_012072, partial [Diploptera punctata]